MEIAKDGVAEIPRSLQAIIIGLQILLKDKQDTCPRSLKTLYLFWLLGPILFNPHCPVQHCNKCNFVV